MNKTIIVNDEIGSNGIDTTIHSDGIGQALKVFQTANLRPITSKELQPPADVRVMNIRSQVGKRITEDSLFAEFSLNRS